MSNDNNVSSQRHPTGLWVLFTTEMWERFAFYAMRAILVLYLVSVSTSENAPGFGWSEADAYMLYGWYTGLVYFSPILGGWIADRFLGQRYCVVLGALLMALSEFFLAATEFVRIGGGVKVTWATDPTALIVFYIGLGLMILGNGFFKPCISVMVGQLYEQGDRKRDVAFTIFYMGINIGAFFAPLVAGTVAEKYGFHLGFIIAGFGMICGLILFTLLGRRHLKKVGAAPVKRGANVEMTTEEKAAHEKLVHEQTRPLERKDYDRIFVIVTLSIFSIAFFAAFEQAGSSLNVFAKKNTDRSVAESVINSSPESVKDYLMNNEKVIEYKSIIADIEALEKRAAKLAEGGTAQVQREPFSERCSRLLSFVNDVFSYVKDSLTFAKKEKKAGEPIVELYPKLRVKANEIKERFKDREAPEFKRLTDSLDKIAQRYPALLGNMNELKKRLEDLEDDKNPGVKDIKRSIEALNKIEEGFGNNFVPVENVFTFPATWYQSVNSLCIVIFAPIFALIWGVLARYRIEPSTPTKFALGALLISAALFVMIPGAVEAKATGGKAAAYWLVLCYMLATWGELCLSPVGLSMVTKLAPVRYASLLMGVWFLASSLAYFFAGFGASYFGAGEGISFFLGEKSGLADFFLLMAIIPMIIGFIALALAPKLKRMMHGVN
ncbi:MAG: oligopeptide:H+ symporter [Planctomycetaceae bacterium]|jgi:POT family proton-dependent oligopeptide transporter|nr:oligopeptide:H+ symporter [Planctomycetaceae bacterium]